MVSLFEKRYSQGIPYSQGPEPWPSGGVLPGLPGIRDTLRNVILLYENNFSRYPVFPRARALALGGCPPWPPWNTGCLEKCFVFTWENTPSQGIPYSQGGPSPGPRGAGVLTGLPGIRDALRHASFLTKKSPSQGIPFPRGPSPGPRGASPLASLEYRIP